jgi:hypothetical protein
MEYKLHQNLDIYLNTNNGSKIKETAKRPIYSAGYYSKSLSDVKKKIFKKNDHLLTYATINKNSFQDLNNTNKLINTPLPRLLDLYHNQVSKMKSLSCSNYSNSELTYFSSFQGPR